MKDLDKITDFIFQPMISYLGNKRKLLEHIEKYVIECKPKSALDGFCGSGVVSRLLKCYAKNIFVNDLEPYSIAIQKAYFSKLSETELEHFKLFLKELNDKVDDSIFSLVPPPISIISKYYSPKDSSSIKEGERCFYSTENGLRIDHYISLLHDYNQLFSKDNLSSVTPEMRLVFRDIAMGNLLVKCSIHTNTSGVFKSFYKVDNIGHWGGYKEHDLQRILRPIVIESPIFYNNKCVSNYNIGTIHEFWEKQKTPIDFVYYDPPYNQHPYGSNYFMLNVIYFGITEANYSDRLKIDPDSISGIPKDWTRSDFNYSKSAFSAFSEMVDMTNSSHILISYNDNGMIKREDIIEMLKNKGHEVSVEEIRYKNLNSRPNKKMDDKVSEYLFYSTAKNPFKNIE